MKLPFKKSTPVSNRRTAIRRDTSPSPTSFSYHARRSEQELNTGRHTQRAPIVPGVVAKVKGFWLHGFGLSILMIALVASTLNIISLSTNPRVVPLTEDASLLRPLPEYQTYAEELLNGSLSNRSKITINTSAITADFKRHFPELGSASVTVPLIAHRPLVYVAAARPALVMSASTGSFVISDTGRVMSASTQINSSLKNSLPSVTDQSGLALSLNVQALPSTTVNFIEIVAEQLAAKNYTVSNMTLPQSADELSVQLAGQAYAVKYNIQANTPKEQSGTFFATVAQLQKQHTVPSKYVDVRVDGRAYYQ
ncbi:MAG: hypothetical protein QFB86_03315 [Patescibacteria group bacterium]|nr:hypothetical protein [Patescibacteria group bacterium]